MKSLTTVLFVVVLCVLQLTSCVVKADKYPKKYVPGSEKFYYISSFLGIETKPGIKSCQFSVDDKTIYCRNSSDQQISIPIKYNSGCEYGRYDLKTFNIWERVGNSYRKSNMLFDWKRKRLGGDNVNEKHFELIFKNGCKFNASYTVNNIRVP